MSTLAISQNDMKIILTNASNGFCKGFLTYLLATAIYKRGISKDQCKRSFAVGSLVFFIRLINRVLLRVYTPHMIPKRSHTHEEKTLSEKLNHYIHKYRRFIAGFASVFVATKLEPSIANSVIISWLSIRALRNTWPGELNHNAIPIIAICMASSQLISCWMCNPEYLSDFYSNFLTKHTAIPVEVLARIRAGQANTRLCKSIHPTQCHTGHILTLLFYDFLRGFKLYAPFGLIKILASRLQAPLYEIANDVIRSSLFLTVFTTLNMLSFCTLYRLAPGYSKLKAQSHSWIPGLASLILTEGSRLYQANFMGAFALDSVYKNLSSKYPEISRKLLILSFCISVGVMLHHRNLQNNKLTDWFLDINDDSTLFIH